MSTGVKVLILPVLPPTERLVGDGMLAMIFAICDGVRERTISAGERKVTRLQFWILRGSSEKIGLKVRDGILIADRTLVPVIRDAFISRGPGEAARVAGDGEEGFEDVLIEEAFRVFGRFVGHEAIDEGVGGGLHEDAGEGSVEEVGVVGNGLVEAGGAEVGQDV